VQDALRRSETYLAQAQNLSHTGSFGWDISSGQIYWSEENLPDLRIRRIDKADGGSANAAARPSDDVADFRRVVEQASRQGHEFSHEYRLRMPDGRIKHIHAVARAMTGEAGGVEFAGAVMGHHCSEKGGKSVPAATNGNFVPPSMRFRHSYCELSRMERLTSSARASWTIPACPETPGWALAGCNPLTRRILNGYRSGGARRCRLANLSTSRGVF